LKKNTIEEVKELNKNNKSELEAFLQKGGNFKPDFGSNY